MRNPPPKKHGPNLRSDGTRVFEDGSWRNRRTDRSGPEKSKPWTDTDTGKVYPADPQAQRREVARSKDRTPPSRHNIELPPAHRALPPDPASHPLSRAGGSKPSTNLRDLRVPTGSASSEAAKRSLKALKRARMGR